MVHHIQGSAFLSESPVPNFLDLHHRKVATVVQPTMATRRKVVFSNCQNSLPQRGNRSANKFGDAQIRSILLNEMLEQAVTGPPVPVFG